MNNCRIPSLYLSVLLLLVLSGLHSRAQVTTNTGALQNASQTLGRQHAAMQGLLANTARAKGWPFILRLKKGRMAYLQGIDERGFPRYVTTTDNVSAATIGTSKLWPGGSTGLNLSGSSAFMKSKIAIWDEGLVRPTHVELAGRVIEEDGTSVLSDHSTHVSGIMIAAGVNPLAKGMAFSAQQLLCYDFNNDESEMAAAAAKGLLISNHSYGDIAGWNFNDALNRWEFWGLPGDTVDVKFGLYDKDAQIWDSIAYNAPNYLMLKAAGNNPGEPGPAVGQPYFRMNAAGVFVNSGSRPAGISSNNSYNSIATSADAKNILTIGAANPIPGGYSRPADVVLASFSSLGPSGDGRIKPDLVADGVNVLSSVSSADNAYDILSGTSMATPAAAGSGFLLQEYYSNLHHDSVMRSATLKGLLIHTADEAGLHPGPDYAYGWGLINTQRAASVITSDNTDHTQLILQNNLVNTTHNKDTVTVVASGNTPLTATICWTDPAAAGVTVPSTTHNFQDTARKLINDLDLRITDSATGQVFLPWILNPFNRPAAATKGDNIRDNVEKVELGDTVIPGHTYRITVSHKGTLARGSQAYSLLISGGGGTTSCTSASTAPGASIDKVTLNNVSFTGAATPPCRNYTDNSAATAFPLPLGTTLPISIANSSCNGSTNNRVIAVYIDFNNNGVFTDPGEQVALSTSGPAGTFTQSFAVPTTPAVGSFARMRIIAEETGTPSAVTPCGTYGAGETQDFRVEFTNPPTDVGITALEYPTLTTCNSDSQLVAIHIHNFGTTPVTGGVPVTTVITGGPTLTAICKDSIPVGGEVIFTYNNTFKTTAGANYTFTSTTALAGDPNTSNNTNVTTVTINAASPAISGTATICGTNASQVVLKATTAGVDVPVWYDSPNSATPIAAGDNTSSTDITANKTYYVAANDLKAKAGPPNKNFYPTAGDYFLFNGNFVKFTTTVPLTIESARLYVGHSGQLTLTLATLASIDHSTANGGYSYFPLYSTTIDLYASKQVPQSGQQVGPVAAGDNTDTGGVYYLNIPVPTPGDYIMILDCSDSTNLFLNVNIPTNPYPISLPGIFSVTGNDFYDFGKADSATYFQKFYYPFYDIGIRLPGCPGPRTAVTATSTAGPTASLAGNVVTSSVATGNQWFLNDSLLVGATGQTDTLHLPGVYNTVVTDPATGCILTSNKVTFTPGGGGNPGIGLTTSPNPSNGVFQLEFFMSTPDNTSITLTSTLGQKVYEADYPNFSGIFSQQINATNLASGMYVLKIVHGGTTYTKKILIKK